MNEQELTSILGRCLEEMAAGETVAACLARYPEHAAELEPLLAMAGELETLGRYRLSDAARLRAKRQLRLAQAAQRERRATPWRWLRPVSFPAPRAAVGLAAFLLCILLTTGVTAASQPGDLAYGLRVTLERVPALFTLDAEARARAELGIAARRLADLDRTMRSQDQILDDRTVAALLTSIEAAAGSAESLPEAEQAEIAARVADQAALLGQLSQVAQQTQHVEALQAASVRARRAAERVGGAVISPAPSPAAPPHEPTGSPTAAPRNTAPPARTPSPRPPAAVTAPPTSTPPSPGRLTPDNAGQQQSTPQVQPTAAPQGDTPPARSTAPGPTASPSGPGSTPVTTPVPGPTNGAPDPGPTSPGPGSTPIHTPGPRGK